MTQNELDEMIGNEKPRDWEKLSRNEKLDLIADRILAKDRAAQELTAFYDLKETGILSPSQYERRLRREVYSNYGSLDEHIEQGVFSRAYRPTSHPAFWMTYYNRHGNPRVRSGMSIFDGFHDEFRLQHQRYLWGFEHDE